MAENPAAVNQSLWAEPPGAKSQGLPVSEYGTVSVFGSEESGLETPPHPEHQIDSRPARLQVLGHAESPLAPRMRPDDPAKIQGELPPVQRRQGGAVVVGAVIEQIREQGIVTPYADAEAGGQGNEDVALQ